MRKISIILISAAVFAGSGYGAEFRFGKGSFSVESNILGTSQKIEDSITTYSLVEEHKNIFGSRLFYSYNITYLSSSKEQKAIDLYNTAIDPTPGYQPVMEYELQGLDAQVDIGLDILKNENGYLGISGLAGISLPYIKNYNSDNNNNTTTGYLPDSKTKIKTYRLGISLKTAYRIYPRIELFGFASYAYQTGNVKNDAWGIDSSVNGTYLTAGGEVKLYLVDRKVKLWIIPLSPKLYLTLGYKYDRWTVNNVKINNLALTVREDDLTITDSYAFTGIGYSF